LMFSQHIIHTFILLNFIEKRLPKLMSYEAIS
jgi:hypothetical protein